MFSWLALIAPSIADPTAIGLFVGSNRPGPGQAPLRYALQDVERMRRVWEELGSLDPERSIVLRNPSAMQLLEALTEQRAVLAQLDAAGTPAVFVFYYSGHARSQSLSLGPTELNLSRLREALQDMPSPVTLAFLDACQSGAISRVKGVVPAEPFSWSSAEMLQAEGFAVMASSTATELSQESDELRGSFFTHHLVSGLRGPADRNQDGVVSLSEAYDYAHRHTLRATAATRTGSQHVTLETQMRGRGTVALTRPRSADGWLSIDGPDTGQYVVVDTRTDAVVAEVVKQGPSPFALALPAGRYQVIKQDEVPRKSWTVEVALGTTTTLEGQPWDSVPETSTTPKEPKFRLARVAVEVSAGGLGTLRDGPYFSTLRGFGYEVGPGISPVGGLTLAIRSHDRLTWAISAAQLQPVEATRGFDGPDATSLVTWSTLRLGVYPRLVAPLGSSAWMVYGQAGGGLVQGTVVTSTPADTTTTQHWSGHLAAATGLQLMARIRTIGLGAFVQLEGVWAPLITNQLEQTANVGGLAAHAGIRIALGGY